LKPLIVTGRLAKPLVERYVRASRVDADVIALDMPVAALLTPNYIARALKRIPTEQYDLVLVPGMVTGDVAKVAEAVGRPVYKGPKHAADLPIVLGRLGEVGLSTTTPACEVLQDALREQVERELSRVEEESEARLKRPGNFMLGGLAFGLDFPIRVVAEVVDAHLKSDEEIVREARRFIRQGADIIDLGLAPGTSQPEEAERVVKAVKRALEVPVSIDTLDAEELIAGLRAGADLILSLDGGNLEAVAPYVKKAWAVIIPTDHTKSYYPKGAEERVHYLEDLMKRAEELGVERLIADLVIDPPVAPGLIEPLAAYRLFRKRHPYTPLLIGVANVTELIDADSVGVNALMVALAGELGVSLVLVTEVSWKARGSVGEVAQAARMVYLAKCRGSTVKDLGLNLLRLKEKRLRDEPFEQVGQGKVRVVEAHPGERLALDQRGSFRLAVDRERRELVAVHYPRFGADPDVVVRARDALTLVQALIEQGLVSRLDHAAYLGVEAVKAELALKIGRSYLQDEELFPLG
jgi:dihydropteroate synthase-like protein